MSKWQVVIYVENDTKVIDRYLRANGFECDMITNSLDDIEAQATLAIGKLAIIIVDAGLGTLNNLVYDKLFSIFGMSADSDIKVGYIYTNEVIIAQCKKYKSLDLMRFRGSSSIIDMLQKMKISRTNGLEVETVEKENLDTIKFSRIGTFGVEKGVDILGIIANSKEEDCIKNYVVKDDEI